MNKIDPRFLDIGTHDGGLTLADIQDTPTAAAIRDVDGQVLPVGFAFSEPPSSGRGLDETTTQDIAVDQALANTLVDAIFGAFADREQRYTLTEEDEAAGSVLLPLVYAAVDEVAIELGGASLMLDGEEYTRGVDFFVEVEDTPEAPDRCLACIYGGKFRAEGRTPKVSGKKLRIRWNS